MSNRAKNTTLEVRQRFFSLKSAKNSSLFAEFQPMKSDENGDENNLNKQIKPRISMLEKLLLCSIRLVYWQIFLSRLLSWCKEFWAITQLVFHHYLLLQVFSESLSRALATDFKGQAAKFNEF